MLIHSYSSSYTEDRDRRLSSSRPVLGKASETLRKKIQKQKGLGSMVQEVKCLLSMCKALCSISNNTKENKRIENTSKIIYEIFTVH
jgi:hypothetical protein